MGSASNTMFFNERPGDITALMAQAALALQGATATPAPGQTSVVPAPPINGGSTMGGGGGRGGAFGGAPAIE